MPLRLINSPGMRFEEGISSNGDCDHKNPIESKFRGEKKKNSTKELWVNVISFSFIN